MNDDIAVDGKLADIEARVLALETKVASLPDAIQLEERIRANLPPPVDPSKAPSFKDIELPIPNIQTVVATAKGTWAFFEMLNEVKLLFWTLFDRRYHMAWLTRIVTILLLAAIMTSQLWLPFAFDNFLGHTWEKGINLLISFLLFLVLHYEMRRYQEWRSRR
jgi:hypothetical protein